MRKVVHGVCSSLAWSIFQRGVPKPVFFAGAVEAALSGCCAAAALGRNNTPARANPHASIGSVLGASVHIVSHGLITKQVVFDPSIRRTNSGFGVPLHIGRYRPRQALAQWTNVAAQPCAHQRECEFSNFQAHRPMELLLASREVAVAMRTTATLTLVGLITPSGDAVTAQRSVFDTTKLECRSGRSHLEHRYAVVQRRRRRRLVEHGRRSSFLQHGRELLSRNLTEQNGDRGRNRRVGIRAQGSTSRRASSPAAASGASRR